MTYGQLLKKLQEMKRASPDKLNDSVTCVLAGVLTPIRAYTLDNAEYSDGSIPGVAKGALFLSDV